MGQVIPLRREFADFEPWVSKREIAAYFSVSTTTIDVWTNEGMPYGPIGGRRKFKPSECDRWHASRVERRTVRQRLRAAWQGWKGL